MPFQIPATLLLGFSALLSRVLGLWRDHLLAKTFGASSGEGIYNLDVYYAAFRIPDFIYTLLIFGAVSAAFVPIFTRYKKKDELDKAWAFASNMLHLLLLVVLVLAGLAYIFAPQLTVMVAGGFTGEAFSLTVRLMRIMLISPILFTFSAIFISLQDSLKVFFYRSLAPVFYNLGLIFSIYYFAENYGVLGLTWGVVLGAFLQLLIQLPALKKIGYRHLWILDPKRPDTRQAFQLLIPRVAGLSLTQLTLFLNTLIASFLATGSITIFYLADNLQSAPLGIIGISFAITSFATLSELASEETIQSFAKELGSVSHKILFLILPATFGMYFLRDKIIDVILVAGKFTDSDATLLSVVLGFLLLSLFAQSLIPLFSRGFYALHNTRIPLLTAILSSVLSVAGSLVVAFYSEMGVRGLALAFTSGNLLNFFLLYGFMQKKCGQSILSGWKVLKMLTAGGVMYAVLILADYLLPYGGGLWEKMFILILLTTIGIVSYFVSSYWLKIPELTMLRRRG